MINSQKIADFETRKRSVAKLRENNRQLELFALTLDELIAMAEAELRSQRRERLQKNNKNQ
ncbi:MAG: hypothetical protein AB4368_25420 [Xenococcaceae cyanobacterium]